MIELFSALSNLLKYRRIHIDGLVFRLHCTLTVIILLAFCITNSAKQLVGEPIHCYVDRNVDKVYVNNYCYINGLYTLPETSRGHDFYPGLGYGSKDDITYRQSHYQWIWFLLLFQSICFYFPRWLWKCLEGNKMSSLISELNFFSTDELVIEKKIKRIVDYLLKTRHTNDWYAIKYFFCELLVFLNVIIQIFLIDSFLCDKQFCGNFFQLGINWINYELDPDIKVDPLHKSFPLLSKCLFNKYGSGGSPETHGTLCTLTINIFNQKIFLFIWFWYHFLALITTFVIAFRIILICCPLIRYYVCRYRFDLVSKNSNQNKQLMSNGLQLGDWFILLLLGENIETIIFGQILEDLSKKIEFNQEFNGKVYSIESNESQSSRM